MLPLIPILPLVRMDWTLNRRILLQMSPIFVLWIAMGISHGLRGLLGIAFAASALLTGLTLLQNLRDSVEPFLCALPVSRRQIVLARYLSALGVLALSLGCFFLLGWLGQRAGFLWARELPVGDLALGLGLHALTLGAGLFLYLPFHFRFGGDLGLGLFTVTLMACLLSLIALCGWQGLLDRALALLARVLEDRAFTRGLLIAWALLGGASLALSLVAYPRKVTRQPLSPALPVLLCLATFLALAAAGR
jgi:hypothetical protein